MKERIEILHRKAKAQGLDVAEDVILYMARNVATDPRGLEEALMRVVAYSSVQNREIDTALVIEALQGMGVLVKTIKKPSTTLFSRKAIMAAVSSIALLGGCNAADSQNTLVQVEKPTEEVQELANAEPLVKATASQQEIMLKGRAEPFQEVFVTPPISSNIREFYVDLGTYVKQGDKLALMFEGDLAYQLKQAEAKVKTVEVNAQIQKIEQQIALNQMKVTIASDSASDVEEAQFVVLQAELALAEAQTKWENENYLFEQGGIPKQQVDQAQKAITLAEQQLKKAKQVVSLKQSKVSSQKGTDQVISKLQQESVAAAAQLTKMGVEQAKADLEIIRYKLDNLIVEAPINGYITKKNGIVGSVPTQGPLFVITNLDQVYITVQVPEAMVNQIKSDQAATVTFPTLGKTYEGKLVYISQVADGTTFPAKILVDNAHQEIKGGMQAQVSIASVPTGNVALK